MTELERTKYLRDLRRQMIALFSLDELKATAFDLSIDWDLLPGEGKDTKVQSLIMHQARRGRLRDLLELLREERPDGRWPDTPPPDQQVRDEGDVVPDPVRAAALQDYLRLMTTKVIDKILIRNESDDTEEYDEKLMAIATAQTAAALLFLDKPRRAVVLRFLAETHLQRAIAIDGLDLSGLDLSGLELGQTRLRLANLSGTKLVDSWFYGADLRGATLASANLTNSHFNNTELLEADLRGAILVEATIDECDLLGADLREANLARANLSSTRLSQAKLQGASLAGAVLDGVDLSGAYLNNAELIGSSLLYANLSHTKLQGADLTDARLEGAINWTASQLLEAQSLSGTVMPDRVKLSIEDGWDELPTAEDWAERHPPTSPTW